MAEFHRLYVRQREVAEGVQGAGESVYDGLHLVGGERAFVGAEGSGDQLGGEFGQFLLSEGSLLTLERDETRDPGGLVDQACTRSVHHEELLDERSGHA
ncbi:hypothetical protein OHT59_20730 [Streptomyces sp. NBC_00243]|nr:hypothetical protein [Streptomyces sp. NBC_00243]WRZ20757.1 hypothetical protein OHT59_20730 [Streptomyces sp. NBC_00243]